MEMTQDLFDAKLKEMAQEYETLQQCIRSIQNSDPDEVHQTRAHLEAAWADTIVDLKNRAKMMRFLTAQQLSQVQLEYCRKAADVLHTSVKRSWAELSTGSEAEDTILYAEYAIDFASLAMRHALLAVASAVDVQNTEANEKNDKEESE